jgi:hypothetical protein
VASFYSSTRNRLLSKHSLFTIRSYSKKTAPPFFSWPCSSFAVFSILQYLPAPSFSRSLTNRYFYALIPPLTSTCAPEIWLAQTLPRLSAFRPLQHLSFSLRPDADPAHQFKAWMLEITNCSHCFQPAPTSSLNSFAPHSRRLQLSREGALQQTFVRTMPIRWQRRISGIIPKLQRSRPPRHANSDLSESAAGHRSMPPAQLCYLWYVTSPLFPKTQYLIRNMAGS